MMKHKKLLALICSLTMIISVFANFSVVNAENVTKGIKLEYVAAESTDVKKVVKAYYVGYDNVNSANMQVTVPEDIASKLSAIDVVSSFNGVEPQGTSVEGVKSNKVYSLTFASATALTSADKSMFTITFTLTEANTADFNLDFVTGDSAETYVMGNGAADGEYLADGDIQAAGVTVPVWTDPNATEPPATPTPWPVGPGRPTPAPTEAPSEETPAPTSPATPIPVTKGIKLEYVAAESTDVKKVVKAYYVGYDNVNSANMQVTVPEDIASKLSAIDVVSSFNGVEPQGTSVEGVKSNKVYSLTFASATALTSADKSMFTITFTLTEANTADFNLDFVTGDSAETYVMGNGAADGEYLADGDIQAAGVTVPVYGDSTEPTPVPTEKPSTDVKLVDRVADDAVTAVNGKTVYLTVEVTDKNGAKAAYGDDYVAVYEGKELSANELQNLLSGYTEPDMAKVINGVVFRIYNTSNAAVIKAGGYDVDTNEAVFEPTEKDTVDKEPDNPTAGPSMSVSNVKATVDRNFDVKTTVKNAKDGAKITYTIVKNSKGDELAETDGSIIQIYGSNAKKIDVDVASNGIATQKFTANKKGTAYIKVQYTDSANSEVASKVISVTVSEDSDSNGGGSSSGGSNDTTTGSGPIAGPSTGGNIGGFITFNDIADVDWAKEAIIMLANKGIISGRGDGIFDPNANITRAEYCQILVGAISKTNESANSSFDDVATDAWYYHAVSVASAYGIVSGYGDGNFGPNNLITRQDMALMTYKAAQVMNKNLSANRTLSFADAGQISDYAKEAVQTLADAGIINGVSDTEFAPAANATRAQSAKILYDTFVKAN